ncbi:hypothetical protein GFJ94_09825 [Flavobacterium sp. LMO8]|uniref:hypothetical protein n=1 Tax=Flavobacterium sp. LMO8 TaxID=2654244 RepID=UPI0012923EAE|nr:hypothetical protein [Flavobacterium sp. LMO8]MQP25361.1 hypothetical protein [Flavobacterium sp. LMO8]
MKKTLLFVTSILFTLNVFSQVGTTTIQNGVEFQIESNSKGLLIPRVALTSTIISAPVGPAPIATGVLVFNTATAGVGSTAVSPGFYYWSGTEWISLRSSGGTPSLQNWSLLGNAGTNPNLNFLGTTDNQSFRIRTNNTNRVTVENDGQVVIGTNTAPIANTLTTINADSGQVGLFVNSNNSQRTIRALNATNTQFVIDGGNLDANGGRGVIGISANLAANATSTVMGVLGVGGRTTFTELPGESVGVSGQGTTGLHVRGVGKGNGVDYFSAYFEYDQDDNLGTSNGPFARIAGKDVNYFTGSNATRRDVTYGGYFDANTSTTDFVFVGARNNNTSYKVLGGGSLSTMVEDRNGNNRILHATETPEILFEDFGTGKLVNGEAYIKIDELMSDHIFVDESHPMKVFIQLEGDCNGVYVTEKTKNGFKVKELQNGRSNISFSWNMVANRADVLEKDGTIASKHVDVRFPIGPKKLNQEKSVEKKYEIETK